MKQIEQVRNFVGWAATLCLGLVLVLVGGSSVQADSIALVQNVQAGKTAVFTAGVRNETPLIHTYALALTGLPDGLTFSFTQDGPVVEKVEIPAQSAAVIQIRVVTQRDTPVGSYSGQFIATRDDGLALQVPVELTVENTYALQITSQALNLSAFSGKEFTFDLAAVNQGAAPVTHVRLQVKTPPKWLVQIDPVQVDRLETGANAAFHATVLVPPSQMAVDQPLKVTVTSDQVSSPDGTVMVRVQKSPNFLYGAALLIAVTVAGVFLYFRRQGRR